MTTVLVKSDEHDSTDDLAEAIQATLDRTVEIEQSTYREDWELGKPCPECGCELLSVMNPGEEIFRSQNGSFEYVKNGAHVDDMLSAICTGCEEVLHDVPY